MKQWARLYGTDWPYHMFHYLEVDVRMKVQLWHQLRRVGLGHFKPVTNQ